MKAIMLCAGQGTRCYPFTHLSPKMTQQICGIPIIEYMLSWFAGASEIDRLYIVIKEDYFISVLQNYLKERVSYIDDLLALFSKLGYRLEYRNPDFEIEVLRAGGWGTGGDLRTAIRQIEHSDSLDDDFVVCNGDYVTIRKHAEGTLTTQLDLSDIINTHQQARAAKDVAMTDALFCVSRDDATRFGVADFEEVDGIHLLRGFREKPSIDQISETPWINAGIYVMNTDYIISNIDTVLPDRPRTNLEKTLLEPLAGSPDREMAAYLLDLYAWFDVGTLAQLIDTNRSIAAGKGGYLKR